MSAWTDFLRRSPASAHAVQVYEDVSELAHSVASYLSAGFEAGEPAVVVATPEHWGQVAELLASSGWDPAEVEAQGLLTRADATGTLAAFMDRGSPSPEGFGRVVGGLIDQVAARSPGRRIRVFGEMVDLLCRRGQADAALALEELWNDLARTRDFSLLCGYRLDLFDRVSQVARLPGVCQAHTHVLPARDPERLARAVNKALNEVLGPRQAGRVYLSIEQQVREERVPVGQLALMWVSAHMPVVADRILASARAHYGAQPAVAAGS